jgi:hypothetical protein
MDIVIRPVNDRFLEGVVFPVFEAGATDGRTALARLQGAVADERTRTLAELLHGHSAGGPLRELSESDEWTELTYRLLFWEWLPAPEGWQASSPFTGYAGPWLDTVHLALMLEHPRYPYWDIQESQLLREAGVASPTPDLGLAAFLCGLWDPVPRFAPHELLASSGEQRGTFRPGSLAVADWSFRSAAKVSLWKQQLDTKLGRLLKREEIRLRPLDVPEAAEILSYWTGRRVEPPMLGVAFSGLGEQATRWVEELGALVRMVRSAAAAGQGLTAVVSRAPNG